MTGSLPSTPPPETVTAPHGEDAVLVAVQAALAGRPGVLASARALSLFGEHSAGWVGLGLLGAVLAPRRRADWLTVAVGAFAAHAVAVLIKRVVRRARPSHPAIAVNVGTPSRLSFPSAHATSTAAAAVLVGATIRRPGSTVLPVLLVAPMAVSRLVLGVHYPSDVLTGSVVGALVGRMALAVRVRR